MRYFTVIVHPMRVQIEEVEKDFITYDAGAIVDGDTWRYKIRKHINIGKNDKRWRERAIHHIHYHAHNSGTKVHFQPVHSTRTRKRKIHEKQKSFW